MEQEFALNLTQQMLTTAAKIAAPFLIACLVVGLIVSIIQVATQIQEMTLTFVPKIIAGVMVVMFFGGWMLSTLAEYAKNTILQAAG
ncbi:flagellar biosynthetic protein FliQ [Cellvibrio zantedeschiae]|uniref:Flagellar biosynthetic protein FliQ n=1 Tax=Cellvibrio zantedeschiae TaxID=1237077 RepID=A0ABQ3BDD8_9GAMM|nr:flagellar biosynthesis protein FliQ [Cellvibrio zantedeschiae]GGY85008.1 flagellar biosynthetic protein FliQ [Cellvibrio zantedeschiae]